MFFIHFIAFSAVFQGFHNSLCSQRYNPPGIKILGYFPVQSLKHSKKWGVATTLLLTYRFSYHIFQNGFIMEYMGDYKMHSITIKNIPAELYEKLKIKARYNRRSINNEVIHCIDRSLQSHRINAEEFIAKIESMHRQHKLPGITSRDLKEGIRKGRL